MLELLLEHELELLLLELELLLVNETMNGFVLDFLLLNKFSLNTSSIVVTSADVIASVLSTTDTGVASVGLSI